MSNPSDDRAAADGPALPAPPFDQLYVAPDVARHADELAVLPRVRLGPGGELWLALESAPDAPPSRERVLRIDHAPPLALLHVRDESEPGAASASVGYLVHESALPTAQPAARLRSRRGRQRQHEPLAVLAFIAAYQAMHHGRSPSERQIAAGLRISAPSLVHRIVGQLHAAGLLTVTRYGRGLGVDLTLTEAGREAVTHWETEQEGGAEG